MKFTAFQATGIYCKDPGAALIQKHLEASALADEIAPMATVQQIPVASANRRRPGPLTPFPTIPLTYRRVTRMTTILNPILFI